MKSFQIRKWQDNYSEICSKEKDKDENLVNAILECANQLAEINEKLCDKDKVFTVRTDINTPALVHEFFREVQSPLGVKLTNLVHNIITGQSYVVRVFGIKLFSIEPW